MAAGGFNPDNIQDSAIRQRIEELDAEGKPHPFYSAIGEKGGAP